MSKNQYPIVKLILALIIGSLFLFYDPLSSAAKQLRARKKKRKQIQGQLKPVLIFLRQKANLNLNEDDLLKAIENSEIDYYRKDSIIVFVINSIQTIDQVQKDAIILTALCSEIENEGDILKSGVYKTAIASIFEKYDFIELDDDAKTIVKYYDNYLKGNKLQDDVGEIDFSSKTDELTRKYNKTYNLSFKLKLEKEQSEEFRRTLSILIKDGKLNVQQLEKSLKERVKSELQKRAVKSKAFLVLSQKFQNIPEVRRALDRFPHVRYSYPKPSRLPENIEYVSTRIIYPSSALQDAEDFLKNEIEPFIPTDKINEGFIAVLPIEGTELFTIPENADDIVKSHLKDGFESVAAYKTGISIDMTELYMESLKDEINVDEVLSNIPINIFVPNLSESRKNFLIDNYDALKNKFNISRLADWANINPDDLKDFLIELDNQRDKKRLYKDENWGEVAISILEKAVKHRDAMNK
ncbi:hypothetical protein GCM10007962_13400 [Yeosuana aromativorans]|uniref:Uncharacterized protein n=1 Tax=Yeosuana aromativorans TaxID=288019 RepID=A0A8J3BK52_9FLAO|nr:hypothetical protein [Yeosuana aromativorans]GGK20595.1 hypothetical protein GCM10007962_13400 [Yeosuana aromativorans]